MLLGVIWRTAIGVPVAVAPTMLLLKLTPEDSRPVFRQIAAEIERCIAVGVLKPGDPLPAVRELAAQLEVNPNTVQHAYRTLALEGAVHVRRGLGTFVAPPVETAHGRAREMKARQAAVARQIAEAMLREGYRHGLLPSDLITALQELTGRRE